MKKLFFCLTLLLMALNGYAQDVIVKFDQSIIVAKILEVADDYITYKDFTNQEGPTMKIQRSNIFKIKFANGAELNCANTMGATNGLSSVTPMPYSNEKERLMAIAAQCRTSAEFYRCLDEQQLKTIMTDDEYSMYLRGKRQDKAGGVLLATGSGSFCLGAILLIGGVSVNGKGWAGGFFGLTGFSTMGLGLILDIIGISLYANNNEAAAFSRLKERTFQQRRTMTIDFGSQRNGIGLALNF